MPGVALQPNNPPGAQGFGSKWMSPMPHNVHPKSYTAPATQSSSSRFYDGMSVSDIKAKAKEAVSKEARGASAITLIKTARTQILSAKEHEAKGDLSSALGTYIKAATLAKMTMDSPEYVQESRGKGGVIRKELNDFLEHDGRDISARASAVEEKLKTAIDKAQAVDPSGPPAGKSIKDRMRALQDNGLSLGQQKASPRELPNLPTPPVSPRSYPPQPNPLHAPTAITPSNSSSSSSGNRAFVSPSSLGPPSPSSTPSSSPPNSAYPNNYDINGFNQAFPSIDELDNTPAFSLPSVPSGPIGNSNSSTPSKPAYSNSKEQPRSSEQPLSPLVSFRNFTVPIERPSSTPITPTNNNAFNSRPSSPSAPSSNNNNTSNRPSNTPLKPSGLSNGVPLSAAATPKVPLPVKNTAFPRDLQAYMRDHNVLLIDVRNRVDFDREHIKGNAVVCVEPSILMREGVTADALENAMVIAPRQETSLFGNRDKFDLVAVYDSSSTSFGAEGTPLSMLLRVIFEQAFRKILKRMPMMLVGGIEAWKRDLGDEEIIRGPGYVSAAGGMEIRKPVPVKEQSSILLSNNPSSGGVQQYGQNYGNGNGMASISSVSSTGEDVNGGHGHGHDIWTPTPRGGMSPGHSSSMSLDHSGHSRSPADAVYSGSHVSSSERPLVRRPAVLRPSSSSVSFTRSVNDNMISPNVNAQSMTNGIGPNPPIQYPSFPKRISPNTSGSGTNPFFSGSMPPTPFTAPPLPTPYDIASPPQASINPSQLSRKRSDFVDQSQEALLGYVNSSRSPGIGSGGMSGMGIDYPDLVTSPTIVRPPPVAAPTLERQDNRPRVPFSPTNGALHSGVNGQGNGAVDANGAPKPPRIQSDYPVQFWSDVQIGTSGLKNLGNTCYMNAPIQCLSATVPFARFFTEGRWKGAVNYTNPLGSKGKLTGALAKLLHEMWGGDLPYLTPIDFRRSICHLKSQYSGSEQHDSQEFLSFLIDGIHEDLNRVIVKPSYTPTPEEEAELEKLPPQIASEREWKAWRLRNDSLIVDFFQGQFRSRLECLTCHKTSTTYNVFSILQLPIPHSRSGKVPIENCLDAFFNEEVLEKDDAWDCPRCKTKRRASKKLSLARLPPVLMVHFKRFEANGRFSDKVDTFVNFPMKSLDLTNYMPPPLPPGADRSQLNGGLPMSLDDPRTQLSPYRYDLYGVTNHYGSLSGGHYTAFIASRGGWMYCDDSSVKAADPKQVVNQKAYVLFYKRVRT